MAPFRRRKFKCARCDIKLTSFSTLKAHYRRRHHQSDFSIERILGPEVKPLAANINQPQQGVNNQGHQHNHGPQFQFIDATQYPYAVYPIFCPICFMYTADYLTYVFHMNCHWFASHYAGSN